MKLINRIICIVVFLVSVNCLKAQENYKQITEGKEVYAGGDSYDVKLFKAKTKGKKPKNVVLMIGDGMGVSHIFAGLTANKGHLYLENFKNIGFIKTHSANNYITDSAAGGTALSCGVKTYNGAIGMNIDTVSVVNIREIAEEKGKSTGVVSTSSITHATPASFIAHQPERTMYEAIAADFLKTDIDVFIGGGLKHFTQRADNRNLVEELEKRGYFVEKDINSIRDIDAEKLAGFTAYEHNGNCSERKDMLQISTSTALNILDKNKKGFFLMIEGSQIDWASHQNNTQYLVSEMLDFDKTIGLVLDFAQKNKETLIIVTADHETGGFAINGGDVATGRIEGAFTTGNHTGLMVPVFAFGPGAENFSGIMENIDITQKLIDIF